MLSRLRHRQSKATLKDSPQDGAEPTDTRGSIVLNDSSPQAYTHNDRAVKGNSSYSTPGIFSGGPRRPSLRTMHSESMLSIRRPSSLPMSNENKPRRSVTRKRSETKANTVGMSYADMSTAFPTPIPVTVRPRTAGAPSRVAGVDVPTHRTTASVSTRPSTSRTSNKSFAATSDLPSPTLARGSLPKASDARFSAFSRESDSDQDIRPKTPRVEVGLASPLSSRPRLRLGSISTGRIAELDDNPKSPLDAAKWADTAYAEIERYLARPSSLQQAKDKLEPDNRKAETKTEAKTEDMDRVAETAKLHRTEEKISERGRKVIAPLDFRGTLAQRRRGMSVSSIRTVDTSILARTPTAEKFQFEPDLDQEPLPLKSPIYLEYTKAAGAADTPNTPALLSAFPQPNTGQQSMNQILAPDTPAPISNSPEPSPKSPPFLIVPPREEPLVPDTPALISSFPAPRIMATNEDQAIVPRTSPRPSENPASRSSTITRPVPSQNFDWLDLGIGSSTADNALEEVEEMDEQGPGG